MLATSTQQGQTAALFPFETVAGYNMKPMSFSIRDLCVTRFVLQQVLLLFLVAFALFPLAQVHIRCNSDKCHVLGNSQEDSMTEKRVDRPKMEKKKKGASSCAEVRLAIGRTDRIDELCLVAWQLQFIL